VPIFNPFNSVEMNPNGAEFIQRHIGPNPVDSAKMLKAVGVDTLAALIDKIVPANIRLTKPMEIPEGLTEFEMLQSLKAIGEKNIVAKNFIGQGYYGTITPSVILRNIFENPGWYTQYTPYQAEIAQGRLESLLNFQTMISDLTGMDIANASLLDEATAAAEAMAMIFNHINKSDVISQPKLFVDEAIFAQTKSVLQTRATPIGVELVTGDFKTAAIDSGFFGAILQYPNANGAIQDYTSFIDQVHQVGGMVILVADLLSLTVLKSPGELNADVAVGNTQRFGVPMGFGGPHAAYFATKDAFKRGMPGRLIGVSIDAQGNRALRMALQTREQHIKREKATSNICTAQALLANMAVMYAVYHGPVGLKAIASRVHALAQGLALQLESLGVQQVNEFYFDTLHLTGFDANKLFELANKHAVNFNYFANGTVSISVDETTSVKDIQSIVHLFETLTGKTANALNASIKNAAIPAQLVRTSDYLTHPVFNTHHSETQMMRYIKQLENKDLSLNTSMISLGSCTMKLNAATEMIPVSWPCFGGLHPFAPANQTIGYQEIVKELSAYLCQTTGFTACSLQPNSGAQGEYAGLLTIRSYHAARNEPHRNIVLIPISAHGTNPASAVMAGFKVVVVACDAAGNIDVADLTEKAIQHKDHLGALMVTYPSTHGVFEETIMDICNTIHVNGGMVYMDGANMNAQVGLTSPGNIGADVCHLNLHKTFAIPHGGGGPGVGPICVNDHLAPFLPGHIKNGDATNAVSGAPLGSASILLISYAYIKMLGAKGLELATSYAILNANYMKSRLEKAYTILYTSKNGTCAHEFIIDLRPFKLTAGIEAEDVAKRLIDYGFHAPTMSFPVAGTIMIEPTESEDMAELDRFCDALLAIHTEIVAIETGRFDKVDNPLKNAPHTQHVICANDWAHSYTRQEAAFPLPYVALNKFWPTVARVNNTHGDRNLVCTCEPVSSYA
jgi:glycine dehydrogenase